MALGITLGLRDRGFVSGRASVKLWIENRKIILTSCWATICGRRDRVSSCTCRGRSRSSISQRASRGMPFHPKVEKRGIALELGGMAKTLEFRALQRVSRSREKKVWRSHYGTANGREVRGKVYTIDGAGGAALEPALELPCRSDSTIGKGHERCSARAAPRRLRRGSGMRGSVRARAGAPRHLDAGKVSV